MVIVEMGIVIAMLMRATEDIAFNFSSGAIALVPAFVGEAKCDQVILASGSTFRGAAKCES